MSLARTPNAVVHYAAEADRLMREHYPENFDDIAKPDVIADAAKAASQNATPAGGTPPVAATAGADTPLTGASGGTGPGTDERDYQQMYKTLKGKYDIELPRLQAQISDLNAQLDSTQAILGTLAANPQGPANVTPVVTKPLLSDEEIAEYGPDLINVIERVGKQQFGSNIERLEQENAKLRESLGKVAEKSTASTRETLLKTLAREVPTWEALNTDEKFLDWLAVPDPYSGVTRSQMLVQAFEGNRTQQVINFFQGYLNEQTTKTTGNKAQVNMDTLVAPGKPNSSGNQSGAQDTTSVQVYTTSGIAQFYRDVREGKFKSKPDEQRRIEAEIFAATAEGKVLTQ